MAGSIKLFESLKEYFEFMAVHPPKSNQENRFNSMNLLIFLLFVLLFLSSVAFLIFEAKSAYDVSFSYYIATTLILAMVCYFPCIVFKITDIYSLITEFEGFIEMSKCFVWRNRRLYAKFREQYSYFISTGAQDAIAKATYRRLSGKIERMLELVHFVLLKFSLGGFLVPMFLLTFGNYFIYGLGDDSYILPCPLL